MKKVIFALLLSSFSLSMAAQETTAKRSLTKEEYLRKARSQNTIAWFMAGGGFGLATAAIVIGISQVPEQIASGIFGVEDETSDSPDILAYAGTALMVGSVPFFIISGKNKKKAASISTSLIIERRSSVRNASLTQTGYPAISVKLNLR